MTGSERMSRSPIEMSAVVAHKSETQVPALETAVPMLVNLVLMLVPRVVSVRMAATPTSAAISAYSIMVTPDWR